MLMLLLGLVSGVGAGVVMGFIPGFSVGFLFLLLVNADPLFALGFVVAADTISSVTKQLNLLNPVASADNVFLAASLPKLLREGKGLSAVLSSSFVYCFVKFQFLLAGIVLCVTGTAQYLKLPMDWQGFAVSCALFLWASLVYQNKNKAMAIVILVIGATFGFLATKLSGANIVFNLTIVMYAIASASEFLKYQVSLPKQLKPVINEQIPSGNVIGGIVSTIFFGIPTSALLKATVEEETKKDEFFQIARAATMEATASGLGLVMALANGSSRAASAGAITQALPSSNVPLNIGLLGISAILTFAAYKWMPTLAPLYCNWVQRINFKALGAVSIILSVATVLGSAHWMGVILIATAFCYQKLIKSAEVSQELSLITISAVPLFSVLAPR